MACQIAFDGQSYNLGGLDFTWTSSIITDTPPSHRNLTWYVNPCGAVESAECPRGSIICGVEESAVDDKTVVTEVIPIAYKESHRETNPVPHADQGVRLSYNGENWGDVPVSAQLDYVCDSEESTAFIDWDGSLLKLEIKSPEACLDAKGNKPGKGGNGESSGGFGFFSFLLFLIFFSFLLFVGVAIKQNRRITDVGPLSDIVRELPYLLKELWGKIAGTFSSHRGGYSAL